MRRFGGTGAAVAFALLTFATAEPSLARPGWHWECVQRDQWHGTRCTRRQEVPDARPADERICRRVCVAWGAGGGDLGGTCVRRAIRCGPRSAGSPLR